MTRRSLRYRLLSAAAISTLLALILVGLGLVTLFEKHLERRFESELETYINQLIDLVEFDPTGRVRLRGNLLDPRFAVPLSGLYWQVQDDERPTLLRSRSLWDQTLQLPKDELSVGDVHQHNLPGPADQQLMVRERQVILTTEGTERRLRVAVARDRRDLAVARNAFTADMLPYLVLLAMFLMGASYIQVRTGLAPLELVRRGVSAIRGGRIDRLGHNFPDEVMPLVDNINDLLQARDASVERARAWTADLAHGLKTPLSALGADAQRLREAGQIEMANDLDELAQTMRGRVDRELIRARLRSAVGATNRASELAPIAARVLKTLQRTPSGGELKWTTRLPEHAAVSVHSEDLTELLGNLLDNAAKWASTEVRLTVEQAQAVEILIEDDGPGVPGDKLQRLGERGLRLDQKTHGYGLGLAIAQDIVEAYGGSIEFLQSKLGGLAVKVTLATAGDDNAQ